ncbi:unnamed protein product [Kuraishia capsulata CBS 1993]|uniref:Putative tyrosine-protein phosphatase OCA1 n=1 Tax=Kuraishia capsulata CBS 1993 TaxID=1382522 RepID=W6MMB4_9ASCO|nr:uncharacterized protein KUCA_T00002003001 [Kuraishia capsulata CBS 1993]CDK26032.1 unnamed protein product [Kuraishia capsulata CBS 1993]
MLVPPDSFGLVEEGVYRCAKLDAINFSFLETLNLTSLILLDPEKPARPFRIFLEDRGIVLHHLGGLESSLNDDSSSKMEDWMLLKPQIVGRIFEIIFEKKNHNVLLIDKSETVIGVLRQIQKWTFTSIINEYRLYSGNKSNYFSENFLELVSVELIPHDYDSSVQSDAKTTTPEGDDIERMKDHSIPIKAVHRNSFQSKRPDFNMEALRSSLPNKDEGLEESTAIKDDEMSLSVSPQIPKNLLKFAEMRKQKKMQHQGGSEENEISISNFVRYYQPSNNWFHTRSKPIKVRLPPEDELPNWFLRQRDGWEADFSRLNC